MKDKTLLYIAVGYPALILTMAGWLAVVALMWYGINYIGDHWPLVMNIFCWVILALTLLVLIVPAQIFGSRIISRLEDKGYIKSKRKESNLF